MRVILFDPFDLFFKQQDAFGFSQLPPSFAVFHLDLPSPIASLLLANYTPTPGLLSSPSSLQVLWSTF
jgi:hypothetical protein